jgi:signal transduction histidine kinase/ActR/RegA family two-component response regulator
MKQRYAAPYMWSIACIGAAVCLYGASHLPAERLDNRYLLLALVTIIVSSTITIQIPQLSGQITIGDTFIFLALLLFGTNAAVLLAAVEGACTSLRVYRKPRTILFNSGLMALTTFATAGLLELIWGEVTALPKGGFSADFIAAMCVMAFSQYALNSGLAAIASACKIDKPFLYTWHRFYLWASITYFAGASAAAIIAKIISAGGLYAVLAAVPIIVSVYCTYRTYLKNIEVSTAKVEEAERHVEELSRYIEDRRRAEEERDQLLLREQEARREAEMANRAKDDFLATISHELRTPMTAIIGWAHMLAEGRLDDATARQAVEAIKRNSQAQVRIIDDLLDMSRIITGKLRLDPVPVNLCDVAAAAIESVQLAASARSIAIESRFDPQLRHVMGDPNRLQQIIWNLLTNAIKFTPERGRVRITLTGTETHARIIVSDTGIGIEPEFLPYVFDRFRQADSSVTRKAGGLGLGLAIVRHMVELHGGTVAAESPGTGHGTTMIVELPFGPRLIAAPMLHLQNGGPPGKARPVELDNVHVLVVDDDADTLDLIASVLEMHGATVSRATSALDALRAMNQKIPDVMLSDISMPGTSGYDLMKIVRALPPECGGRVPSASLTALAREEDRAKAFQAGFQAHITKPVIPDRLVSVVAELASQAAAKPSVVPVPGAVLVATDEPASAPCGQDHLVTQPLRPAGF